LSSAGALSLLAETKEALMIAHVERRLISKYSHVRPEEVSTIVQSEVARFAHSPIRDFVPLLVERHANARLAKLESLAPAQ
jgi:hypothetical protein